MKLPAMPTKAAEFVGSALDDLSRFPAAVKKVVGHAVYLAQIGGKHLKAKPLAGGKAFKGAVVLEVVEDYDGDTFRAVYTIRFGGIVYVFACFSAALGSYCTRDLDVTYGSHMSWRPLHVEKSLMSSKVTDKTSDNFQDRGGYKWCTGSSGFLSEGITHLILRAFSGSQEDLYKFKIYLSDRSFFVKETNEIYSDLLYKKILITNGGRFFRCPQF